MEASGLCRFLAKKALDTSSRHKPNSQNISIKNYRTEKQHKKTKNTAKKERMSYKNIF